MSDKAVAAMDKDGLLDDPMLWIHTPCSEDVVISLYVRAVKLHMADFNGRGEPFGVINYGLPFSPAELVERGYAVIHSLKDYGPYKENETRAFFQRLRLPRDGARVPGVG